MVRARTRRAGNRWGVGALYGPGAPRTRRRALDGWPRPAEGIDSALVGLRGRVSGKRAFTRPPHPEALQIDDPPTRAGFITALDDAYLMPREDGYAVFSRTSGRDLCTVRREVAERALRRQGTGRAAGHLVGHAARPGRRLDAVVGPRGPVGGDERRRGRRGDPAPHRALAERARAGAGAWTALGPAAAGRRAPRPCAGGRPAAAPTPPRARGSSAVCAPSSAPSSPARSTAHMIAVIAGGDGDRGTDVREQMTRSAALLFGERGFSGTGLREVIAHSSTPRGSIYHHFAGGKAELAREAVRHAAERGGGPGGRRGARRRPDRRRCTRGWTTGAVRSSAATSTRAARCSRSRSSPRSRPGPARPPPRPSTAGRRPSPPRCTGRA